MPTNRCQLNAAAQSNDNGNVFSSLLLAISQTTLQFTIWDLLKEVEASPVARLDNLAALMATLMARHVLPLSALKVVSSVPVTAWTCLLLSCMWLLVRCVCAQKHGM